MNTAGGVGDRTFEMRIDSDPANLAPARKAVKAPGRPILDRTPDLPDDDVEPVPSARPVPQARPIGRPSGPASGAGQPATPRPPIDRPILPPPPRAMPPVAEPPAGAPQNGKRKPWWRPGG